MKDISLHMLDIVRNSIKSGADKIGITIKDERSRNRYIMKVSDNGSGISPELMEHVTDPFCTTSVNKKVGLGLPLLKQNTEQTGGRLEIRSDINKGTTVKAVFRQDHIDMIPRGDIADTVKVIIASEPEINLKYTHFVDKQGFEINTAVIRKAINGTGLNTPEVLDFITQYIHNSIKEIESNNNKENKI